MCPSAGLVPVTTAHWEFTRKDALKTWSHVFVLLFSWTSLTNKGVTFHLPNSPTPGTKAQKAFIRPGILRVDQKLLVRLFLIIPRGLWSPREYNFYVMIEN